MSTALPFSSNADWGAMLDRRVELSFAKVQAVEGLAPGPHIFLPFRLFDPPPKGFLY